MGARLKANWWRTVLMVPMVVIAMITPGIHLWIRGFVVLAFSLVALVKPAPKHVDPHL